MNPIVAPIQGFPTGTPGPAGGGFSAVLFGSGSDGAVTISGNTTLTRTMHYSSLTVDAGVTLTVGEFAIFCTGTVTNNGTIKGAENAGANASGATGGSGAQSVLLTDYGTIPAGSNGRNGGTGAGLNGTTQTARSTLTGADGGSGGAGGAGSSAGGTASGVGVATERGLQTFNLLIWNLNATSVFTPSTPGSGGASGGGDGANAGGGGGQGGQGGIPVVIFADTITNNGTISSNGGNGGNGAAGVAGNAGGGGGGGGGSGGYIYEVFKTLTAGTQTVTGGVKGTGGAGSGTGVAGNDGTDGETGKILKIDLTNDTVTVS